MVNNSNDAANIKGDKNDNVITNLTIAVIIRTKAPRIMRIVCTKSVHITAERPVNENWGKYFCLRPSSPPPMVKMPAMARRIRIAR